MFTKIDKRSRAEAFRHRLVKALSESGLSQSELARRIRVDRSTVSQLLTGTGARLPNAQVIAECASALAVSSDWLLSLSDRAETASDLLANAMTLTKASRTAEDEQIFKWHKEAAGYKIRHVPATLPDMLKCKEMLEWEYGTHSNRSAQQAIGATKDQLTWLYDTPSDYEIALPEHELTNFLHQQGYYADMPKGVKDRQVAHLLGLCDALYPRLRVYLFDARQFYASPVTIFGPLLAALYIGQSFLVFRDSDRIRTFTQHFDQIIKVASINTRALSGFNDEARELK